MKRGDDAVVLLPYEWLVFEAEGWGIIALEEGSPHPVSPYASHKTCESKNTIWGYRCWDERERKTVCTYCLEEVPECIQTLITIHGWKR